MSALGFSQASYANAVCSSAVVDLDGDGWGYENNRSCKMPTGHPTCSSSAILSGDGWGYQNGVSCIDKSVKPACTANAINSGGGWGWENGQSCRYGSSGGSSTSSYSSSSSKPSCTSAAINNGDGWGWENNTSCKYRNGSSTSSSSVSTSTAAAPPPPPVTVRAIGYQNGDPICLTDASDGNSDGFGYENDRSCRIVAGQTATSANPLLNTRWCQPWAEISYDDYVLQNNTWNFSDVYSNRWSQCIELGRSGGNYVAKWDYNWLKQNEGQEYSVKSYPQVYYGRKTKNSQSGTPASLGLPAKVTNLPDFKVRYRYSEAGNFNPGGTLDNRDYASGNRDLVHLTERNVALESFFHTSCEAEEYNKQFEMMVWVNKPHIKTPGKPLVIEKVGGKTIPLPVTIDDKEWYVYTNPSLGWGYIAFVEVNPSNSGTLDWSSFVDWTVQWTNYDQYNPNVNKSGYKTNKLNRNSCMGAIEIGTETFWGQGSFTLHEFNVFR